ncbi:MAG: dephospho-CoA kinase [Gemmatimonadales bacterium]|nr:MAG: dephospho-CoA kinase [Gemmatimonadales bacterium]
MIRVGLTGTLGAGKSTVGDLFERWGAWRIDADLLAREAIAPDTAGQTAVICRFGDAVVASDGTIDRAALGTIVFTDADARMALEEIIHPEVDRLRVIRLRQAESEGARIVVMEVPLLFEKGIESEFDHVVVVDAPIEIRQSRVVRSREISADMFSTIDATQWSGKQKREAADSVIWNDDGPDELREKARQIWDEFEAAATEGRTWSLDLHMHTSASHDCLSDPADVVRQARRIGLDRIAITDHNELGGALAAHDLDPELVIVGEEVRTSEGLDLIGLWLERRIPPGGSFREVADAIHAQGGIVYVPHPFDSHRGTTEEFLDDLADCVDAVETFNARIHDKSRNARAAAWAERQGLPAGAGSDAHTVNEIGRARVLTDPFAGPDSFLQALRNGRVEGRTSSPLVHLASTWAKLWK